MALLRAFNPDLWQPYWGGEKPFEFGFLNAILRSPVMPPYDPFFSGGAINYYYYGLFLASLPIKATGIAPAVGFNLVIATLLALTLVGAFAVVARLTGRLRYGLVGGVFVALLGNLAAAFPVGWGGGLMPVLQALGPGLAGFGERLGSWFVGPSRVIVVPDKLVTINEFPFWSYLFADLHPHLIAMPIATLVVALAFELFAREPRTKNREPADPAIGSQFSVLGSGFLAALALGALAVTNPWDLPTYALLLGGALLGRAYRAAPAGRLLRGLLLAVAQAGAVVGGALLLYLPFFQNYVRPAGVTGLGPVRDGSPLGPFLLIYGLYLLILGMWLGGLAARLLRQRRVAATLSAPELPGRSQSALGMVARPPSGGWLTRANALMLAFGLIALVLLTSQAGIGLIRAGLAAAWASPALLKLGLLALLAAGAPALLARRLPGRVWFTLWMAVLAWAVSFGVELVYIRDHLDGGEGYRMNTVFKFGLQAWMLMALAAAAARPWLGRGLARAGARAQKLSWAVLAGLLALALLPLFSALTAGGLQLWMLVVLLVAGGMLWLGHLLRRSGGLAGLLAWALIAALVALALVYPAVGIPSRLAYRFAQAPGPTLDGLAFMEQAEFDLLPEYLGKPSGETVTISLKDDLDAIGWLNEHVAGSPVVLQSDLWFYRTYGVRVAANTGLPTIVSPLHASEQHDPRAVADRDLDAQEIYYTLDQRVALKLLARYRVGYIYVGQIERAAYGAAGLAKFERMNGPYLRRVYRNPTVTIYQVNPTTFRQPWDELADADQGPAGEATAGDVALSQLERDVAQDPGALGPLFRLAQRYRELRRLSDAVEVVRDAVGARPRDVALRHLLGDLLRDDGREYRAALAAEPTAANWNKLGAELLKWGRLTDAADALGQAVAVDPTAAEPHYHLGVLYERQGDRAQAIKQYRAYLALALPSASYYLAARAALDRLE
jgi:YYY domain-containing protein